MTFLPSSQQASGKFDGGIYINTGKISILILGIAVIAFPKMGIPLGGGVPLYASVFFGEIIALIGWYYAALHGNNTLSKIGLALIFTTFLMWFGHFMVAVSNGISMRGVARIIFNFLPFSAFGIAYYIYYKRSLLGFTISVTRWSFYFLLIYSALQMLVGADTVAVPYITANYDESFDEIIKKTNVIHRLGGDSYKLFATYQNGNLFAIALILISPFAFFSERRIWVTLISAAFLHVIIVFSASTTSYLSLCIMDALYVLSVPRLRFYFPAFLAVAILALISYNMIICSDGGCQVYKLLQAKLFERDLTTNARWDKTGVWLDSMADQPWILFVGEMSTAKQFVFEVLPFSIAQYYGIVCVLLFYAFLFKCLRPTKFRSYKIGLTSYLITSVGSGGFWLTPTPYLLGVVCGLIISLDREYTRSEVHEDG